MNRKSHVEHLLFEISVIGKGVDGALEIIGGALLLFVSPNQIQSAVRMLTQHELSQDPHDLVATHLLNSASHVTAGATLFAAAYLLWHGAVKLGLVIGLLMKRRWAYPAAIVAFILFVVYQLYRYSHTRSVALLALTVLDLIVIALTWLEYKRLKTVHGFARR
ncbi:MAG TPA: DUF2127 domain-containing protein [Thermoanaerobaculia bacterium]